MDRRAFTLIEVLIVVVIVGVLGTFGFPAYQNFIENSKAKACQAHLEALQGALDMHALDLKPGDTMPASLSQLPEKYIKASYARLMQQPGAWKVKLAYFAVGLEQKGLAYAEPFIKTIVSGNAMLLICPADADPVGHDNISYALNTEVAGIKANEYLKLSDDKVLIGDCDSSLHVFSNPETQLASRHVYNKFFSSVNYAQGITKSKRILKKKTPIIPSHGHHK